MLTELRIRNFAIIEQLVLPLDAGLNVLSGETGAGKSIVVGALGLLLGERGNTDLIRAGADRASVEGTFEIANRPDILAMLDSRGIDAEDPVVVLKRELHAAGRSRAWINGATVTAGVLAEVGRLLVDLHGQHEAQTLLDTETQRTILDAFGGAEETARRVRGAFEELADTRQEIATLARRREEAARRADYLRHVASEIEGASLVPGEEERLEDEARRLEHSDELRTLGGDVLGALDGEEGALLARLSDVHRWLASLQRIDPSLARLQESFDAGYYALEELARSMETYLGDLELDPARLEEVRRRRDLLFRLTGKYGGTTAEVIETGRRARAELDLLESAGLDLRQLEGRAKAASDRLDALAAELSAIRTEAGERLAGDVDALLPALGMPDGRFAVRLLPREAAGAEGAEDVEFVVSLNVGHDARPLARVASGGELSRVMLALKTILARLDRIPTLVFDEVDAGIGGRVGAQVGGTMRQVAGHHQVLAITHLPQIAARAHHHIRVAKGARDGITTADVAVLEGDARITEIARMLGGDPESELSRAHARELLASATAPPEPGTARPSAARGARRARQR